jgi:ABC-2 type transport system permease protein
VTGTLVGAAPARATGVRAVTDVLSRAARIGIAELAAIYTWRTWLLGWFVRLITQAVFFTAYGLLLGPDEQAWYRAIGNTVVLVCIEATVVIMATVRERNAGTLALQVVSPTPFALTYLARSAHLVAVGTASATAAFYLVALLFGVPLAWPEALSTPLFIAVIGISTYCFGLAVGSAVMRLPGLQWLALNLSYLTIMTFCGVNVAVSYWPVPLQALAQVLPLTHGLEALRTVLAAGPAGHVLTELGLELAVGAGWAAIAVLSLGAAVRRGRRTGSLELSG